MASHGVPPEESLKEIEMLAPYFESTSAPQEVLDTAYSTFKTLVGRYPLPHEQKPLAWFLRYETNVDRAIMLTTRYIRRAYHYLNK